MAVVYLAPTFGAGYQGFTSGGLPLNAGLIYTYIAGGTTPKETYTTSAGTVQNANPVVLAADGRTTSEIWFVAGTTYRIDVKDSAGNLLKTYDNLAGMNDPTSAGYIQFAATTGLGTSTSNGTGTIGTTAAGGVNIQGRGSVNDVSLLNRGGTPVVTIPTGSTSVVMNSAGIVVLANGAAGAPSLQFAAGATTGMMSVSATSFAAVCNGAVVGTFSAAGLLLTGLTVPTSAAGTVYSDTYTPTITSTANVAASTARLCTYSRVGNTVTVSGQCNIDPTLAAPTLTQFGLSLPVASNFSTSFQCGGVGAVDSSHGGMAVYMEADAANDRVAVSYNASDVSNQTIAFTFTYQVI